MDPAERLERLERALADLVEAAEEAPVLVEGVHDEQALRSLGVRGPIVVYNRIGSMIDLADRLRTVPRIIVLLDWDRKGGHLSQLVRGQLAGQVQLDFDIRKELAVVSLVKCVEDLPHARRNLRRRVVPREEDGEE